VKGRQAPGDAGTQMSEETMVATNLVEILLVEDNPGDVELTREAFEEARVRNRLHMVGDGVEALAFLRRQGRYAQAPRPDIVLLDLNLPKKSGLEVLTELKQDPDLRRIPVIAHHLTSRGRHSEKLSRPRQRLRDQARRL